MTGTTTYNKATVPAGADGWNLLPGIRTAIESANVPVPVASKAERDALAPPGGKFPGLTVVRTDTPDLRRDVYSGSAFVTPNGTAFTPTWSSPGSFGTGGSVTGAYWVRGDLVTLRTNITAGTGSTLPAGVVGFNLPTGLPMASGLRLVGPALYITPSGGLRHMVAICTPGSTVSLWVPQQGADALNPGAAGLPWGSGYSFEALITYQTTTVL